MSSRVDFLSMIELSANTIPPDFTIGSNLSNEGPFIAITMSGAVTSGEPIGSSEIHTEQLHVPPRISGPYEGSHESSFPSIRAAFARSFPEKRTPCPPNPHIMVSVSILVLLSVCLFFLVPYCFVLVNSEREVRDHFVT